MNSKERILLALNHQEPDRVPMAASFTSEFAQRLQKYLGLSQISIKLHDKSTSEEDEYTCE
jgi:uroporphyrinogen decarboxylase